MFWLNWFVCSTKRQHWQWNCKSVSYHTVLRAFGFEQGLRRANTALVFELDWTRYICITWLTLEILKYYQDRLLPWSKLICIRPYSGIIRQNAGGPFGLWYFLVLFLAFFENYFFLLFCQLTLTYNQTRRWRPLWPLIFKLKTTLSLFYGQQSPLSGQSINQLESKARVACECCRKWGRWQFWCCSSSPFQV